MSKIVNQVVYISLANDFGDEVDKAAIIAQLNPVGLTMFWFLSITML